MLFKKILYQHDFELLNTDFNTVSSDVKDISETNYYNWYDLKEYKYD